MFKKTFWGKSTAIKVYMLIYASLMLTATMHIPSINAATPITIYVSPSSAPVGSTVTVWGTNATQNGEVRIYVYWIFLATTIANATGVYSVNITAPAVPVGTFDLMALDVESGSTASTSFTIEPRMILTPTEGSYNQRVSVKGDGFQSVSNITLTFDWMDVTPWPEPQTDFLGSFEASFYVPPMSNGIYVVTATDEWGNTASADFQMVPKLNMWPMSGAPTTLIFFSAFGFASNINITVRFDSIDITPYPFLTTGFDGSVWTAFLVPDVPNGIYTVNATDATGNTATAPFAVPTPILSLTPTKTFESSIVTANGMGFQPGAPVLLYLEDITMTSLIDLMWMSQDLMADEYGSFEYSFIVPVTEPGVYTVGAYAMLGGPFSEPKKLASASLTIADNTPIDVEANVGSIHFRGEIAEFYVKTVFDGRLVNATVDKAMLYYSSGTSSLDLTVTIVQAATGLYRIPYSVPNDAPQGTYTLLVETSYTTNLVESFGAASGSFLLSPTLTSQNAQLIDVQNKVGTIVIPDLGVIKANLTAINARLVSVEGREATIQSDIGTLKTNTDTINAEVTSIDGNVATISSDLGTVKTQVTTTGFQMEAITLVLALVAAAGSMISAVFIRRIKPSTSIPSASLLTPAPTDPTEPPEPRTPTEPPTEP